MPALFNLANQYLALAHKLADGDFDVATIADTIEASGITDELATKAQGIEYVARGAESHNAAIDAEIARLQALKAQRSKVAAGLRSYLLDSMQRCEIERIDCPMFSISIRKNPPSVEVDGILDLPTKYLVKKTTYAADKKAIAEVLKSGKDVKGARLVSGVRLVIA